jgi:SpoVK/Ycf46/Vps4 family AAA+-type ATPase
MTGQSMAAKTREPDLKPLFREFNQVVQALETLYRNSALDYAKQRPDLVPDSADNFVNRMMDLCRGLILKIFVDMAEADHFWSDEELFLAQELFAHLWGRRLGEAQTREALGNMLEQNRLTWDSLVGPFQRLSGLRPKAAELQTLAMRLATLVGNADGAMTADKARQLRWMQTELERILIPVPLVETAPPGGDKSRRSSQQGQTRGGRTQQQAGLSAAKKEKKATKPSADALAVVLEELDALIGLDNIKQDVRELVNFLKIQKEREKHGLPATPISLHTVFSGNPGTGKTTVARLFGRILGAMGILSQGHLIETDRSGLVAEFTGQTAPKTNKKIDEALDGVLFIDEAYSLVAEDGEDPYGAEALQILIKRMEDDRDRVVVILAGYPEPLKRMLESNPGLSSRFPRNFHFLDYTGVELGRIFAQFCSQNRYALPARTRAKLLMGFQYLLDHRDEHFGNGRLSRNIFELGIRRLANRIASITPLTPELLTMLEPEDIVLSGVAPSVWNILDSKKLQFRVQCPGCKQPSRLPQEYLGQRVVCQRCKHEFQGDWGEIMMED